VAFDMCVGFDIGSDEHHISVGHASASCQRQMGVASICKELHMPPA
jgi:hypothetical protein